MFTFGPGSWNLICVAKVVLCSRSSLTQHSIIARLTSEAVTNLQLKLMHLDFQLLGRVKGIDA